MLSPSTGRRVILNAASSFRYISHLYSEGLISRGVKKLLVCALRKKARNLQVTGGMSTLLLNDSVEESVPRIHPPTRNRQRQIPIELLWAGFASSFTLELLPTSPPRY